MTPGPSISVAIPSYNRRSSLSALVAAAAEQLADDDELIVVDDGSTDGSAEEVMKSARCRLIRHEVNQGMVKAWNACLKSASRDWICIIHNDDRIGPGALDAIRTAARLAPNAGLIAHRHTPSQAGGWCAEVWHAGADAVLNSTLIPSGASVSRSAVEVLGAFDERFDYSTDIEYFARVASRFDMVVIRSPQIVDYRLHDGNYQYATWRKPDFFAQLRAIEDAVMQHTGVTDERREYWRNSRWTGYLSYMFKTTRRLGDRQLLRKIAEELVTRPNVGRRLRVQALIANQTGWSPSLGV
jgi:glycosyltransferase involved in cell wall biosynthesis